MLGKKFRKYKNFFKILINKKSYIYFYRKGIVLYLVVIFILFSVIILFLFNRVYFNIIISWIYVISYINDDIEYYLIEFILGN